MGSPRYMAPEIARSEDYNLQSEVYTVSLLVHEVLTLQKPYEELPPEKHSELVHYDCCYRPPIRDCWHWPFELIEVLHRGWNANIHVRPSMNEFHSTLKHTLPKLLVLQRQQQQRVQQQLKQQQQQKQSTRSSSTTLIEAILLSAHQHKRSNQKTKPTTNTTTYSYHNQEKGIEDPPAMCLSESSFSSSTETRTTLSNIVVPDE